MIHRIDRVNPDVDDRVIKPNEARMAENLRFGASTEDTNLSGGSLVLGNRALPFDIAPGGINKVVGVLADNENRVVYFALWNINNDHGIYRINSNKNDEVERIVRGSWLGFSGADDFNVSMATIRGLLYWTDNVNDPRVVNVEKGIRTQLNQTGDVYPPTYQSWHYTQIKRPPGQPLDITPVLGTEETSSTYKNKTLTNTGVQYSYYYIYDNNEESRLAPYTNNSYATYDVTLSIPDIEFNNYTKEKSLIKSIVIVARNGNDGVWRELQYQENDAITKSWIFKNIQTAIKNTVASDITDARFDSVPLQSFTNEIAQNRLNHANYIVDYKYTNNITIEAQIRSIGDVYSEDQSFPKNDERFYLNSFVPWGRYTVGVEFVDQTYFPQTTIRVRVKKVCTIRFVNIKFRAPSLTGWKG